MNALVTVQPNFAVSDLERMARAFSASKLFGVQNPDQALALCLVAQAEGRHPASAAQDYHIISGRPAKKADAMLRDFLASGGKVEWHALSDEKADATFSHPSGGAARIDWTLQRAKDAGINNPMWKKYPRQMLRSRVVSEGVRTVCPGATSGMYVPEEMQDIEHERTARPVTVVSSEPIADDPPQAPEEHGLYIACKAAIDLAQDRTAAEQWSRDNEASLAAIKAESPAVYDAVLAYWKARVKALPKVAPQKADPEPAFDIADSEIPF